MPDRKRSLFTPDGRTDGHFPLGRRHGRAAGKTDIIREKRGAAPSLILPALSHITSDHIRERSRWGGWVDIFAMKSLATWVGAVVIGQWLAKNDPAMFQVANLVGGNGWFYNRKGVLSFSTMLSHTQKGKQNILVVLILTL